MRTAWHPAGNEHATEGAGFKPLGGPLDSVRLRREPNTRDAMNARLFSASGEQAQAQAQAQANRLPFMDMAPINSRTETKSVRAVPELVPSRERSERPGDEGVQQSTRLPSLGVQGNNPYLARLDTTGEGARNVARELRGAVTEDAREWHVDASRKLTERQFSHRWLDEASATRIASLSAVETLRPQPDDFRTNYRGSGGGGQTGGGRE